MQQIVAIFWKKFLKFPELDFDFTERLFKHSVQKL